MNNKTARSIPHVIIGRPTQNRGEVEVAGVVAGVGREGPQVPRDVD